MSLKSRPSSKPKNGTAVKTGSGEVDFHDSTAAACASPANNFSLSNDRIALIKGALCSVRDDRTDKDLSVGTIHALQITGVSSPRVTKTWGDMIRRYGTAVWSIMPQLVRDHGRSFGDQLR